MVFEKPPEEGRLQQQQQQLFFCAVDLSWFFIMGLFAWFLKSRRRRVDCNNNRAASKHKSLCKNAADSS
jgi:hypothetical protein